MVAQSSPAALTVTASPYRTVTASSMLAVGAGNAAQAESIDLLYRGATPNSQTNNLSTKGFADTYFSGTRVDEAWIDNTADSLVGNLLLQADVSAQINALDGSGNRLYPKVGDLTTTLNNYVSTSKLGTANGIAKADASGTLAETHIPAGIKLDNKALYYNGLTDATSSVFLISEYTATTSSVTEYKAASFTIPDPGFAYYPMSFVYIQGIASGTSTSRYSGTNNVGRVIVAKAPTGTDPLPKPIFSQGVCAPVPYRNWTVALPWIEAWTQNPPVKPITNTTALRGDLTLHLYLSNYQGSGYTFYRSGLVWSVILFPTNTATVSA